MTDQNLKQVRHMLKFSQVFSQKINAMAPSAEELERAEFRNKYHFMTIDRQNSVDIEKEKKARKEVSELAKRIRPNLMKVEFDYKSISPKKNDP